MASVEQELSSDDVAILKELDDLVKETFLLWDEIWIGFSWRHYYFNHTQRVKALGLEIGRREGADLRKLEYAATLHDITKRYDGRILTDSQGRRILDENGFWRNELLMPKRENLVTKLYREFNQFGSLHNVSGAFIARKILESYGFPSDFCASVGSIIEGHLKPDNNGEGSSSDVLERRILYEADTIDANLGLTAFYRNVQIRTHYATAANGRADLRQYISHIEPWIGSKTSSIDRIVTETGTDTARQRHERMKKLSSQIRDEFQNSYRKSLDHGILGIIKAFMDRNQDPNLVDEMDFLFARWIPEREKRINDGTDPESRLIFDGARDFCYLLSREIEGKI